RVSGSVEIAVSDTGVGIGSGFLPFVFDRFRQGDGSRTRHRGGLGVGLGMVRHLTLIHRGSGRDRRVRPHPGPALLVALPHITNETNETSETNETNETYEANETYTSYKSHEPQMSPTTHIEQLLDLDGLRVLAVDDDSDARDLIRAILPQYGAIVETVGST